MRSRLVLCWAWLTFDPTSGSWLNLVDEVVFGIITRQTIRRVSLDSVKELINAIERFIDTWNERGEPFIWTTTADAIVQEAMPKDRKTISVTPR